VKQNASMRHSLFYLYLLADIDELFHHANQPHIDELLDELSADWDQIKRGQAWAVQHNQPDEDILMIRSGYCELGPHVLALWQDPFEQIEWLVCALDTAEQLDIKSAISSHLTHVGNVYASLNHYPEAIDWYQRALTIEQEQHNQLGEAATLHSLGQASIVLGDLEEALEREQAALQIYTDLQDQGGMAAAASGVADMMNLSKSYVTPETTISRSEKNAS